MEIRFPPPLKKTLLCDLKKHFKQEKWDDFLFLSKEKDEIKMRIKKMGESLIAFQETQTPQYISWKISREKIAFQHRFFRNKAFEHIHQVVSKLGGSVVHKKP